jgi:hypothetical protein
MYRGVWGVSTKKLKWLKTYGSKAEKWLSAALLRRFLSDLATNQ